MVIDFKDDIVDEDGVLSHYSYKDRMKKFYPLMKEAQKKKKKQRTEFKHRGRTYEFVVDKDGTGSLRKKPIKGGWF